MNNRTTLLKVAVIGAVLATTARANAALTPVASFGDNPSSLSMFVYVPTKLAAKPPIVVVLHYCSGSASAYYTGMGSSIASLADRYGYVVIYPQTTKYGSCWDVFSAESLRHDGGSDSKGVVSMVSHALKTYDGDPDRVYVVGSSSGAMMTNVLLGAYPDVFKAGASFSGVTFGCWSGADPSSGWNSNCANGKVTKTPEQWGAGVLAAYPTFKGVRPRVQIWHGDADTTINFANFTEMVETWTNVLGTGQTPTTTETNTPKTGFTRTRFQDGCGEVRVEAVREAGQGHSINVEGAEVVRFFGLDHDGPDPGSQGCGGDAGTGPTDAGGVPTRDAGSSGVRLDAGPADVGRADGGAATSGRPDGSSSGGSGSTKPVPTSGATATSGSTGRPATSSGRSGGLTSGADSGARSGNTGINDSSGTQGAGDQSGAASASDAPADSSGCACRVGPTATQDGVLGLAVLGVLGLVTRRRVRGRVRGR